MLSLLAALAMAVQPVPPPSCTPERSTRATVAEMGENTEKFIGRCVTLEGLFTSISLYGQPQDLYLVNRYWLDGNADPALVRRGRIGLYSQGSVLRGLKLPGEGIPHIRVTGTVDTCERKKQRAEHRERAAGKPAIIMMVGYCHYHGGAVIDVTSFAVDPARRYERLAGERARERFGSLVPMPAQWPFAQQLRGAGTQFLAALLSRDRQRLIALHDFGEPLKNKFDKEVMALLLDRPDSPFVQVRSDRGLPMQLFVDRLDAERMRSGKPPERPSGLACFCRTPDCTGRWPISLNDADNWVSRPYACTAIAMQDWAGGKLVLHTQAGRSGWLKEPARTAFRAN